jgi:hypothetical protein
MDFTDGKTMFLFESTSSFASTCMVQFVYWEKGRDVFDRLLIDSDWAINNGNWLWLSASAFFHQVKKPGPN